MDFWETWGGFLSYQTQQFVELYNLGILDIMSEKVVSNKVGFQFLKHTCLSAI